MKKIVYSLIKIFNDEQHRDEFLNGSLYMNRLKYFKQHEEDGRNNRADIYEAVSGWFQPGVISIRIDGIEIPPEDIATPVVVQLNKYNDYNIFCMFSISNVKVDEINDNHIDDIKKAFLLDDAVCNLGEYAAIITNVSQFLERVEEAIKREHYSGGRGLVEYYEPSIYNGKFLGMEAVFKKQIQYSHQKEYRIAIERTQPGDDAYHLEIGNIHDICISAKTSEINSKFEIRRIA